MKMNENFQKERLVTNYRFRVIFTLIWFFLGAIITIFVITFVFLGGNIDAFRQQENLTIFIEIVSVGLLQIIFVIVGKDDLKIYGFTTKRIGISLLMSSILLVLDLFYNYILSKLERQGGLLSYGTPNNPLSYPAKYFYPILGLLAYGPLEVFFVIFLLRNMEKMLKEDSDKIVTKSVIVTPIIFGLLHIITTVSKNVYKHI